MDEHHGSAQDGALAGCNLFITHEPTYYDHHDDPQGWTFGYEGTRSKRAFIEESGITIIRCHDLWDQVPKIGIPDAWGEALALVKPLAVRGTTASMMLVADPRVTWRVRSRRGQRRLARRLCSSSAIQGTPVHRVAIGTGAITPLFGYVHDFGEAYGLDLAICTDDGFTYWREGAYALDTGLPVIIVNHATAEEPGMQCLADHLRLQFPAVPVRFVPRGCIYRQVTGQP